MEDYTNKYNVRVVTDRESILRALEDCPDGLGELRGVLLREHEWRKEQEIV